MKTFCVLLALIPSTAWVRDFSENKSSLGREVQLRQIDYRRRLGFRFKVPGVAGVRVRASLEYRYVNKVRR